MYIKNENLKKKKKLNFTKPKSVVSDSMFVFKVLREIYVYVEKYCLNFIIRNVANISS